MSILSAQSIRYACVPSPTGQLWARGLQLDKPLIDPFVERGTQHGMSYGLSACTYDCRISQHLTLYPKVAKLAATIERFAFPPNMCGSVLDKSSLARRGVSAFNTHLDPGWEGYLTVELINFSDHPVVLYEGDPVCQVKFEWLDHMTILPYKGKYQNQEAGPQEVRHEV